MAKPVPARDECPRCGQTMTVADTRVPHPVGNGHHATLFQCSECGHEVRR
jgi:predicted RNA-binding Zn-ribbon protein involved in translation (DUF1610 family)